MKLLVMISAVAGLAGSALAAGGSLGSGLVVLDTTASGALSMNGNASIQVPARAVYVNSNSPTAVSTVGNAVLDAPNLYIVGNAYFGGHSLCTGVVHPSGSPFGDPLSGISMPNAFGETPLAAVSFSSGNHMLTPGYYANGISISGNTTMVTFAPGVYKIGGSGFHMTSGNMSGAGVCFVMLAGGFSRAGNGSTVFTPPIDGPLNGVVICQPSSNTTAMSLAGGSNVTIAGAVYAPNATLSLAGTATVVNTGPQMGDLIVARKVSIVGTALVKIGQADYTAIVLPRLPLYD